MRNTKNKYDLNLFLVIANILISGVCFYLYNVNDDNDFINIDTLILLGLLAIENIVMLVYEKKARNPFIIILVLVVTIFYLGRVASILHIPASVTLWDSLYVPSFADFNDTLLFILLANFAMFAGFYLGGKNKVRPENTAIEDDASPKIKNSIIIIALTVAINFFFTINLGQLTGYVQTFFNRYAILLFTFTMLAYNYDKISLKFKMLFIVIVSLFVILITMSGSRSGILSVAMILLMAVLAVKQKFLISKKNVLVSLLIIPVSIAFFSIATFKQQHGLKDKMTIDQLVAAKEANYFDLTFIKSHYLPIIYYRLGFLDYSTELIADKQKFAKNINGQYYFESIVDTVLSPGFDVFGTPRSAHALNYIRRGEPIPDAERIVNFYQSDQMGIYGEYYVFFNGYPALIIFFFMAFIFQTIFANLKTSNALLTCIYRAVILNLFYVWLNSFGMDWFVSDVIIAVITAFIFARFYVTKRKRKVVFGVEPKKDAGNIALAT